jgi:hypothetical protein
MDNLTVNFLKSEKKGIHPRQKNVWITNSTQTLSGIILSIVRRPTELPYSLM